MGWVGDGTHVFSRATPNRSRLRHSSSWLPVTSGWTAKKSISGSMALSAQMESGRKTTTALEILLAFLLVVLCFAVYGSVLSGFFSGTDTFS